MFYTDEQVSSQKVSQLEKKNIQKPRQEIILRKGTFDIDYGFNLAFSNSFMGSNKTRAGHVVHWVNKGGVADVCGLRDGDRIVSVSAI